MKIHKIHFHEWSAWSEIVNAYYGAFQYRYCKSCNEIKKRKVGKTIEFNLVAWNHKPEVSNEP